MMEGEESLPDPLQTLIQAQEVTASSWRTYLLGIYSTSQGIRGRLENDFVEL
jgi:hypothetical protein